MMRPIGCWRERKVCYKMFCVTVSTNTKEEESQKEKMLSVFLHFSASIFSLSNVSENKADDLFASSTWFYRCSAHRNGIAMTLKHKFSPLTVLTLFSIIHWGVCGCV